jgi:hypothetical protein
VVMVLDSEDRGDDESNRTGIRPETKSHGSSSERKLT